MAVPKKKRYKEIVKTRHSLEKLNFFKKNQIGVSKYMNFANISSDYKNTTYCTMCNNVTIVNNLCPSCYVFYFLNFFIKKNKLMNKKKYTKNLNY